MEQVAKRDVPEDLNKASGDDTQQRPPVKPFDPHFRPLFECSESFFRRYEITERPRATQVPVPD